MKQYTLEGRARSKNGVKRLCFSVFCILLEAAFIVMMITKLNEYAEIVNLITRLFAGVLVLALYASDKTSSMKMPWVILILIFPIMGVALYLLIGLNGGTRKMRERYADIDRKLLPLLPDNVACLEKMNAKIPKAGNISAYIQRNAHYPVYQNTDVTYYDAAEKGLDAQLEDLSKAEKFIFMEYHAIEDDKAWKKIQNVLEERVKAGVEVRVFYDDMGSIGFINTDFVKKLEFAGIHCRVFNPFMPGLNVFLNNRDHRKITVIDGKIGFTGGYNLANEYFNYTHPYGQWKDTGIRLEGDAVRSLTITFLEMWNAVSMKDINDTDFDQYLVKSDYQAAQEGFIQPYADSPMDDEQVGEEVYISMINKAERYCWFMTPYLIITDEMTHALCLAAKRGVDVRIITPGMPDKKLIYSITRSFYHGLVKNGVRIYEWTPGFCHAKMSVADDCMATCGTINLDYRSLYHHFENGCFMADSQTVLDIRDDLGATMNECREVTEKYRTGRSAYLRLGQLFMRLFAGLLQQSHSALVQKITIIPRTSGALGYTMQVEQGDKYLMSKKELENKIATFTGGRAAEEIVFGEITTGASNDIEQATKIARAMITRYGMTENHGNDA